ncbi:MAG: hypothetical protein KGJ60_04270 [Verrucomicrobiota bacterium]|nr:hypothetical protein [Verrucomicrobiota bacterium]
MKPILRLSASLLLLALLAGCGKPSASSVAAAHSNLFPSSPLKEQWDTAMAAMQTNGYVTAVTTLKKMQLENVNDAQLTAINDTLRTLNDQILAAADKGDANAAHAMEELRNTGQPHAR